MPHQRNAADMIEEVYRTEGRKLKTETRAGHFSFLESAGDKPDCRIFGLGPLRLPPSANPSDDLKVGETREEARLLSQRDYVALGGWVKTRLKRQWRKTKA